LKVKYRPYMLTVVLCECISACIIWLCVKPVFHFNRIVAKRSVFLCFLTTRVELMTSTQKTMLRYVTIRLKWKTGLRNCVTNCSNKLIASFNMVLRLGRTQEYTWPYPKVFGCSKLFFSVKSDSVPAPLMS
jgi:hypothetical protein